MLYLKKFSQVDEDDEVFPVYPEIVTDSEFEDNVSEYANTVV